ncbi:MAG: hypothetical protein HC808_05500 [Candidatus Competibacteraceae bacterium]|nr:hypothetical protein [Candidatus Competibacteraceae bacterium]
MTHFVNYHLIISRQTFENRSYQPLSSIFSMEKITPEYDVFSRLIEEVGGPWNWTKRPRYHNNKKLLEERLSQPETQFLLLKKNPETLGYCLAGTTKDDLTDVFAEAATGDRLIEIENFGFSRSTPAKDTGRNFYPLYFNDFLKITP